MSVWRESLKKRKKKCLKKFVSLKNWKKSEDKEEKHLEEMVNAALVAAVPNPGKVTRISTNRQWSTKEKESQCQSNAVWR